MTRAAGGALVATVDDDVDNLAAADRAHVSRLDQLILDTVAEEGGLCPCDLVVADGTSVLGADDKAGVTVLMETAARLLAREGAGSPPHGDVYLAFVPDEEIGLRGVRIEGVAAHPISAKGVLVNRVCCTDR